MENDFHFAALDVTDVFRAVCGAWRRAQNWTTLTKLVTCRACLQVLAERGRVVQQREERTAQL